jgi:hypothetical protein
VDVCSVDLQTCNCVGKVFCLSDFLIMSLLWEDVLFDGFSCHQLEVVGRGGLIQARVLKLKKAVKGDANAREVSDALPFLGMVISKPSQFILIDSF